MIIVYDFTFNYVPLNYVQNLNDFSLLMLNGKENKIIPVNEVKKVYVKLQSNYDNKEPS